MILSSHKLSSSSMSLFSPPLTPRLISLADIIYIVSHLSCLKAPGFDLEEVLCHFSQRGLVSQSYQHNSILRIIYFPILWKFTCNKFILKPNKPPNDSTSCRPISLLPLMSNSFERLLKQPPPISQLTQPIHTALNIFLLNPS